VRLRRLTVAPDPAGCEHRSELVAVATDRFGQDGFDRRAGNGVAPGPRGLAGGSEESQRGHAQQRSSEVDPASGAETRGPGLSAGAGTVAGVTEMLLVRHGQSEWNAVGRWQGNADPALTELGRLQAIHAAGRVGAVDVVVASPLIRALETARLISNHIGVGPVVVEADLAERDAGEWEGLTRSEIERDWPGYLEDERRPPGYEGHDVLMVRVAAALARVHADYDGAEVLVVTHGGVIGAVERDAGLPWERLPNLGGVRVTHHDHGMTVRERIVLVDPDELTIPSQL